MSPQLLFVFLLTFLFHSVYSPAHSEGVIRYSDPSVSIPIGSQIFILEDRNNSLTIEDVKNSPDFLYKMQAVPNMGITESTFWVKFIVENLTDEKFLVLEVQNPVIDDIELFSFEGGIVTSVRLGEFMAFNNRGYQHPNYLFDLQVGPNRTKTYFLKVKSIEQLQLPMDLGSQKAILEALSFKDLIFGIYIGIILVMVLYNIFIYFTVHDSNYIYYVIYIFTVGLTMASLQGFTFKYLWPDSYWMARQSTFIIPALSGIAVALFLKRFLKTKERTPNMNQILNLFIVLYIISMTLSILGFYKISLQLIQFVASVGSLTILGVGIILSLKGDRQAKIFLTAWSIFLIGVCIFVLKNLDILPYNNFTAHTMQAGSALEVILLSFALADRINILKKEKEESQAAAYNALKENEKLILEQNLILEKKVKERTLELQDINEELNITLNYLKETQSKLVESEKMASLGQLTAGIAHEINNPINFVASSISPLRRDIDFLIKVLDEYHSISSQDQNKENFREIHAYEKRLDMPYLKEEIDSILKGVADGANRTTEIVKGLRNFSRLDESELKTANIHEGIDSTLVLLNNKLDNIKITKNYGDLPLIECHPGKLNQVFMNLLSNSIHAVLEQRGIEGEIVISTCLNEKDEVLISIKDNGAGIPENIKNKIFEPFFTTKDVGEGTGLGLSIVYNIIQSHEGSIVVQSELGKGAEFLITLPRITK